MTCRQGYALGVSQIGRGLPAILPDHLQGPVRRPTALAVEGPDAIAKVGGDVHQERSRDSSESGRGEREESRPAKHPR